MPEQEVFEAEVLDDDSVDVSIFNAQDDSSNLSAKSLVKVYERSIITSTNLTLKGQRLLRVVLSQIKPDDADNKVYSFSVSEYQKVYGIEEYPIKQLKQASDELLANKTRTYEDDPKGFLNSGLISYLDVKDGVAKFSIPPPLLPFYNAAREKQQYILGYTKNFDSSYSFPFYELFLMKLGENKENPNSVDFIMTVKKLREWLKIENSYVNKKTGAFAYNNFKTRILERVKADINKQDESSNYMCDVNFDYEERKSGRSIYAINFKVWKVHVEKIEEPILNPFYESLAADVKLGYDALLALNIKRQEIENAIVEHGNEKFSLVVKYIISKKNKGLAYLSACLRNGWYNPSSKRTDEFVNIERAYTLFDSQIEMMQEVEAFLANQSKENKYYICNKVKAELADEPQILKHILNLDVDELLATRDLKVFFIEALEHIVSAGSDKHIAQWYNDFTSGKQDETGFEERTAVIEQLKAQGVHKRVWNDLLVFSDERILANINYCIENYQKGKKQKNIAGLIVNAIKDDYAQYEIKAKEAELKAEKDKENEEFSRAIKQFSQSQLSAAKEKAPDKTKIIEQEIAARKEQDKLEANEAFESMYDTFMEDGSIEDKENYKNITLDSMVPIAKQTLAKTLNVNVNELSSQPLEAMLEKAVFVTFFKGVLRKEFGL